MSLGAAWRLIFIEDPRQTWMEEDGGMSGNGCLAPYQFTEYRT
jgi:hypothetical protein